MFALAAAILLAADPQSPVELRLTSDGTAFEAVLHDKTGLAKLKAEPPADWATLFRVVVKPESPANEPLPLLGTYSRTATGVRFEPRFPPAPGVTYRLTYHLLKMPIVRDVALPKVDPTPRTAITAVYPTANRLPENTLRFYVQFSSPMNRKDIYRHVRLLREDGKPVDTPFLEIEEQLWSADGTRLMLLCDPGRVKRGLVPREEGPILEEGHRYTLVIDRDWEDADGRPLKDEIRKTFDVGPPDDSPVDPQTWSLMAPAKNGTNPLIIRLAKPLDRALLARTLHVTDTHGKPIDGSFTIGGGERVITFAPAKPWLAGRYQLVIDTHLEDICGNRVGQAFEVDEFKPITQTIEGKAVSRAFEVR
jgi:hypothetical protein